MRKILLIRSSSLLFEKVLNQLREEKDLSITALVASPVEEEKLKKTGVQKIIYVHGKNGFKLWDLLRYKKHSIDSRFDQVICLYNNKTGDGYLNVDCFALLTPALDRIAYNYDREVLAVDFQSVFGKFLKVLSGYFWLLANTVITIAVYLLIFAGMLVVEVAVFVRQFLKENQKSVF